MQNHLPNVRTPICVFLWFVVLAAGLQINSSTLDDSLLSYALWFLTATIPNVGLLAILSSLVGKGEFIKSVRRGFTIYVMLISGAIVVFTESFESPTQQQYSKIAGMVSLICILMSYRPELFDAFIDKVTSVFIGKHDISKNH